MNIVLIIGPDSAELIPLCDRLRASKIPHVIIGDGKSQVIALDQLQTLARKIGPQTHVVICAHGLRSADGLSLHLGTDIELCAVLGALQAIASNAHDAANHPLPWRGTVHVVACQSGAGQKARGKLAPGSMLMTHNDPESPDAQYFCTSRVECLIDQFEQVHASKQRSPTAFEVLEHCMRSAPDTTTLSTAGFQLCHVPCADPHLAPPTHLATEFGSFKTVLAAHGVHLPDGVFHDATLLCSAVIYGECQFILQAIMGNGKYVKGWLDAQPAKRRAEWLHGGNSVGHAWSAVKWAVNARRHADVPALVTNVSGLPLFMLVSPDCALYQSGAIDALLSYFTPDELAKLLGKLDNKNSREFVQLYIAAAKATPAEASTRFYTGLHDSQAAYDAALAEWEAYATAHKNKPVIDVCDRIHELHLMVSTLNIPALAKFIPSTRVVTPHAFMAIARKNDLALIQQAVGVCYERTWQISLCSVCLAGLTEPVRLLLSRKGMKLDFLSRCVATEMSDPWEQWMSPLHAACVASSRSIVELLLDAGADTNMIDDEDRTPLDIARLNGDAELVALLTPLTREKCVIQ
ncbi:MAG: ankyrin repeat domain-containing protein [Variovorax sp.]